MPNTEEPSPSPEAELAALLAEEAKVQAERNATPQFERAKWAQLNTQLNRLSATIVRHCAYHRLARPT